MTKSYKIISLIMALMMITATIWGTFGSTVIAKAPPELKPGGRNDSGIHEVTVGDTTEGSPKSR